MASFGSAKTIGIAALAVVLAHGAVLTLVMVNLPSVTVKSPEVPSLIQILSWKEPLPTTPPTPQAFPSPVQSTPVPLTSEVTEPQPSVAESPLPHPAVEAAPTEIPVSETSYTAATVQAPITAPVPASYAPADVEYLPQSGVTLAPVVPAQDLLKRIRYPDKARKLAIQGTVNLELFIDRTGSIRRVEVLKDPGYGFAEAALKALEGLVCQPAMVGGDAVAVRFRYPVRFTLR